MTMIPEAMNKYNYKGWQIEYSNNMQDIKGKFSPPDSMP